VVDDIYVGLNSRPPLSYSFTFTSLYNNSSYISITPTSTPPHISSPYPTSLSTHQLIHSHPSQSSKTTSSTCTDACMDYPKNWESSIATATESQQSLSTKEAIGHQEQGRTVVLHSVAIAPGFQNRGMGRVLMKSYVASIVGAGVADRLVLLAHEVYGFSSFFYFFFFDGLI
jgi:GNAT superfamily N-acetyltransferase